MYPLCNMAGNVGENRPPIDHSQIDVTPNPVAPSPIEQMRAAFAPFLEKREN
jgi:hypothetical protein